MPTAKSAVAPDGRYTLTVTATDPATATSSEASTKFVLDTKPPLMLWGSGGVSPSILTSGPLRIRFRLYDLTAARVTLDLVDQGGRKLKTRRGYALKPGKADLRWPSTHGARLAPSTYELSLSAVDEAGNSATSTPKRFLVIRPVHSRVWANFSGVGRRIALTFDDCYVGSAWGSILDTLKRYAVKATFFCPGQAVLANPSLGRRTVRDGHVIGSHGWDHANFSHLSFSSSDGAAERRSRCLVEACARHADALLPPAVRLVHGDDGGCGRAHGLLGCRVVGRRPPRLDEPRRERDREPDSVSRAAGQHRPHAHAPADGRRSFRR